MQTVLVSKINVLAELVQAVVTEQYPGVTVLLGITVEAPNLVSFSAHSAVWCCAQYTLEICVALQWFFLS
jgi:hypothetical protein